MKTVQQQSWLKCVHVCAHTHVRVQRQRQWFPVAPLHSQNLPNTFTGKQTPAGDTSFPSHLSPFLFSATHNGIKIHTPDLTCLCPSKGKAAGRLLQTFFRYKVNKVKWHI